MNREENLSENLYRKFSFVVVQFKDYKLFKQYLFYWEFAIA